jgi:hypothetical protein
MSRSMTVIHDRVSISANERPLADGALTFLSLQHPVVVGLGEAILFDDVPEPIPCPFVLSTDTKRTLRVPLCPIAAAFVVAFHTSTTVATHRLVEIERPFGAALRASLFGRRGFHCHIV